MRSMFLMALMLVAGCGDDPVSPKPIYSMAGTWTVPTSLSGTFVVTGDPTVYPFTCTGSTTAVLADASGTITGSSAGELDCVLSDFGAGLLDMSGAVAGTRTGATVAMTADLGWLCAYTGTMTTATAANGTVQCDYDGADGVLHGSGEWNATRN